MSRRFGFFAGNDEYVTLAPGNLATVDGGPISVLAFVKPTGSVGGLIVGLNAGTDVWAMLWDALKAYVRSDFTGGPTLVSGEWQLIGYDKATGSSAVRWHHFQSGSWSHSTGSAVGDGTGPIDTVRIGLALNRTIGLIAAEAVWDSQLGDAGFEAAGATALADWMTLNPAAAWRFNQADVGDPVVDLTGGGADQTAIAFTQVSADDPPGWSYDLAPPPVDGALTIALPSLAAVLAGGITIPGALALTLPALAAAFGDTAQPGTLTVSGTMATLTAAGSGAALSAAGTAAALTASGTPSGTP